MYAFNKAMKFRKTVDVQLAENKLNVENSGQITRKISRLLSN